MERNKSKAVELTYPLRTVARLTGLSPEVLRAWERRYGVVSPERTPGGSRRYSAAELERLRLVKAAVDAGHRIGQVASLPLEALRSRAAAVEATPTDRIEEILDAFDRMQGPEAQRLLSLQLSALGPARFAREVALPLVREIGERWSTRRMSMAAEHLASGVLRSMLGAALVPTATSLMGPRIVFGTPPGERHELGLLMAALTALGAGANPVYLGPELPVEDLIGAVEAADASVLALSLVTISAQKAASTVAALRAGLDDHVHLWLGGAGASQVASAAGVEHVGTLEDLEQRVALLAVEGGLRR